MKRPCDTKFKMHFGYGMEYPENLKWITKDGFHHGNDYLTPKGSPLYAICDGIVCVKSTTTLAGQMMGIKFWKLEGLIKSTYRALYMHLSKFSDYEIGDAIKEGNIIGYSGDTGSAKGHPHLHFQMEKLDIATSKWKDIDPKWISSDFV